MLIANPIYDVVFKYLMEDHKVAKLLIGGIIGEKVLSLEPRPREHSVALDHTLTVYRLDFSAVIQTAEGKRKAVIIELQKAKFYKDILRFRRYLGKQYAAEENVVDHKAMPLVSIYILGHRLDEIQLPLLHVSRVYRDGITGEKVDGRDAFVEGLTHDSFVVQIPCLSPKRRNELEILLGVFDQRNRESDHHILNVADADFPAKYRPLIRRLQLAASEKTVRDTMEAEDEVLGALQEQQRKIAEQEETIKKTQAEKDAALAEKDEALAEKDEQLAKRDQALAEKDRIIEEMKRRLEGS